MACAPFVGYEEHARKPAVTPRITSFEVSRLVSRVASVANVGIGRGRRGRAGARTPRPRIGRAGASPGGLRWGWHLHLLNQVARGAAGSRSCGRRARTSQRCGGVTSWPPGSRARVRAGCSRPAAATPCGSCCCGAASPTPAAADRRHDRRRGSRRARRRARAAGRGAAGGRRAELGAPTSTLLARDRASSRSSSRPARASRPCAGWRHGWRWAARPAPPGPSTAHRAPVAARQPRLPLRRPRLLPRRLQPPGHPARHPARHVRPGQRPPRPVRPRRCRRHRRDARGQLRSGHRRRGPDLAARRLLHRHEHGAHRRGSHALTHDLPPRRQLARLAELCTSAAPPPAPSSSRSSSATSAATRRAMSSRVARTSSTGRPFGVFELPVEVALAGDVRAGVAAAHRHHDVGLLGELAGEALGAAVGEVDPELAHDLDDLGGCTRPRGRPRCPPTARGGGHRRRVRTAPRSSASGRRYGGRRTGQSPWAPQSRVASPSRRSTMSRSCHWPSSRPWRS